MEKVLWFKHGTWNVKGLREKEEELYRNLYENNINISVIVESKKKLQGTRQTESYTVISSGTKG